RQMLAALMQMLENMRMMAGNQGGQQGQQGQGNQHGQGTPQQNAMNEALQGLGDIMGGQRQLLDKTFRAERGQQGHQGQGQQGLRDKLDKVIQGLSRNGVLPQGLDQAGREMGNSRDNLSGNQLSPAEQAQQRALDQLRNSAQQLAKNLMAANGQQPGANDQNGERTDPLGRPLDQAGSMAGGAIKLP